MLTADDAMLVVLDPAVILHEVMTPNDRPVCNAWRDGCLRPVVSRPILSHTLRFLADFGVQEDLLRTWALWLSHRDKVHIVTSPIRAQCAIAAYTSPCVDAVARGIVTSRPEDFAGVNVKTFSPECFSETTDK